MLRNFENSRSQLLAAAFAAAALAGSFSSAFAADGDGPSKSKSEKTAQAAATKRLEFFEKKIRPVLVAHCYKCHADDAKNLRGGLRVDTRAGLQQGGDSGPAVVPGKPEKSLILQALRYSEDFYQMPPDGKLPKNVAADFETWIRGGAVDPRDGKAVAKKTIDFDSAREHWAFQPVQDAKPPTVRNRSWGRTPVDDFILARLEAKGLPPAAPADRRTLIRRVTFDLTGLPPTPDEVEAFLADDSPGAFERVVDRLLSSPHYGERWARRWMDVVRFAETNGHNRDIEKPNAFRYRDYLIDAFNQDVPFDRFILENLAGDKLEPRTTAFGRFNGSVMGTGMLWFSELHHNPVDALLQRADQVDVQIDTVGKAFLGLTLGCARCHDHKFDPVPITDYYALAGIFHSTKNVNAAIGGSEAILDGADPSRRVAELQAEIARWRFDAVDEPRLREVRRASEYLKATTKLIDLKGDKLKRRTAEIAEKENLDGEILRQWMVFLHKSDTPQNANLGPWLKLIRKPESKLQQSIQAVLANNPPPRGRPINPFTVKALSDPPPKSFAELADRYQKIMEMIIATKRYNSPKHKQWLNWFHRPDTPFTSSAFEEQLEEEQLEVLEAKRRELGEWKRLSDPPRALASADADDNRWPEISPIRSAFPERRTLGRATMGDVRVHIRGSHKNLGDPAPRRFLTILAGENQKSVSSGSGRLRLAREIADADNPLTARVTVNRLWTHYFGDGLVRTVDNFGLQGEPPSHPELLDFLAKRFVESGWSIKQMHRMLVLSSTYRMSSRPEQAALQADPDNRLRHHFPARRLDAESIRDAILAVSGGLNRRMYGKGVTPYLTPYMYPRYRPKSGPVDGDGRRSVYISVRRNFLPSLLAAFDMPEPNETVGDRSETHVANQPLVLLNSEFVHEQAATWGRRVAAQQGPVEERLQRMFATALGRPASREEVEQVARFWDRRRSEAGEETAWGDVAHVLFNLKAFAFVR
jgi:hypothetical protein